MQNPFEAAATPGSVKCAVYIPATIGSRTATNAEIDQQTDKAISTLSKLYGGATCIKANGAWIDGHGESVKEPITIVYSYTDTETAEANAAALYYLAQSIARDMMQDCVTTIFNNQPYFVEK